MAILVAIPALALDGKIKADMDVGPNKDVHLKAGQSVQVLKQTDTRVVIMAPAADGSSVVCEIGSTDIDVGSPATSTPAVPAPAPTAQAPVAPVPAPASAPAPSAPASPAPAGPPTYPDDFVGGATVSTTDGERSAGTASVVELKGGTQTYILSARHMLGPEGGFKNETAAADVPAFVQRITIHSFSGGSHTYEITPLLVPAKHLKPIGSEPVDDMAVYQNKDTSSLSQAVPLADAMPALGTELWVIAHVRGGVPQGQVLQSGKVTGNSRWIELQFDNDGIDTAGASGAPVLNSAGEVVGVYSGHSKSKGHVYGYIIPAPLIISVIQQQPAGK